jgi:hypothetical protein
VGQSSASRDRDRRGHLRVPLASPVLLDLTASWEQARGHDLSPGGLAVELPRPLPVGAKVDLYFELPTLEAVEATAEVVRSQSGITALRFVALAPTEVAAIVTYCDDRVRGEAATGVVRRLALPGLVRVS